MPRLLDPQRIEPPSLPLPQFAGDASLFAYTAWLVDLDGTLYRQSPVRAMMVGELILRGQTDIKLIREFRLQHEKLRVAGTFEKQDPYRVQIENTARALRVAEEHVQTVVDRWMINRPGKWLRLFRRRPLLRAISKFCRSGGKTAVVSDYPARGKLAAMGLSELFDIVIASGEPEGPSALKPHPAGLLLAADRLAVDPQKCLVIGDREDADGAAARRAGMAFRHVNSL